MAVDFARGYPRYRPYDGAVQRLARGAVGAVLMIGSPAGLPQELAAALSQVPAVAIGPRASNSVFANAEVVIDTAVAGIHETGTALRMDDVPLPLTAAIDGVPSTAQIVAQLAGRLAVDPVARTAANRR
jgi:formylmethanofuran dehydrogenase subunit B